jgi:hypothetical protein
MHMILPEDCYGIAPITKCGTIEEIKILLQNISPLLPIMACVLFKTISLHILLFDYYN